MNHECSFSDNYLNSLLYFRWYPDCCKETECHLSWTERKDIMFKSIWHVKNDFFFSLHAYEMLTKEISVVLDFFLLICN